MSTSTVGKEKSLDIILLGRIAIDFNPIDYYKPLSESVTFKKYVGGSPANTAVGLARLGKKCGFFARVSDDQFGDYVTNYMEKEGIDVSAIRRCEKGEKTGLAFTEILDNANSSILMYRDNVADLALSPDDINEAYLQSAKLLLISGTALAASPSREAAIKALLLAKKHHLQIVFDIDYRPYNWKNFDEVASYYALAASMADIIMGSRREYDLMETYLGLNGNDRESATYWLSKAASIVIIKHGKEGSFAYLRNGEKYQVKPFPVTQLKAFGGGDAYSSSFLNGYLNGWPIMQSLEYASASAAKLVASHACSEDMPTIDELEDFIYESKKLIQVDIVEKMNEGMA